MNVKSRVLCILPLLFSLQLQATNDGGKERAEKRIISCYVSDLRGKSCSPEKLKKDGEFLFSLYQAGDRSVLASLMRVNALSVGVRGLDAKFFTQAMQHNLDGFLSALSSARDAKSAWLNSSVVGSACDCPGIAPRRFKELRGMLRSVRQESVVYGLAQQCREDLEDTNATLIFTYFSSVAPSLAQRSPGSPRGVPVITYTDDAIAYAHPADITRFASQLFPPFPRHAKDIILAEPKILPIVGG